MEIDIDISDNHNQGVSIQIHEMECTIKLQYLADEDHLIMGIGDKRNQSTT